MTFMVLLGMIGAELDKIALLRSGSKYGAASPSSWSSNLWRAVVNLYSDRPLSVIRVWEFSLVA